MDGSPSCVSSPTKHPMALRCRERAPSTTLQPAASNCSKSAVIIMAVVAADEFDSALAMPTSSTLQAQCHRERCGFWSTVRVPAHHNLLLRLADLFQPAGSSRNLVTASPVMPGGSLWVRWAPCATASLMPNSRTMARHGALGCSFSAVVPQSLC
jgi:hypothetical protein